MNIEDEEIIEDWFLTRNIKTGTQEPYMIVLSDYMNYTGKNPSELVLEAERENLSDIPLRRRKVTRHLLRYKKKLEDDDKAPNTVNLYFSAMVSFYKAFDIILPEIKIDSGDIGLEKNIGRPLTRKDIHKLISVSPPREKALIYLMALSGMGQQEARDLKIRTLLRAVGQSIGTDFEDVHELIKNEDKILQDVLILEITRKKVKLRHHTFMPPETSREVLSYLKMRCYGQNEKIRVKNNDDYVFVNNAGKPMSRDVVVTNFRRIGIKAGFKKEKGAYSFWRSHALRKYFIGTIINKTGEKTIADYMAGHTVNKQDRTYWPVHLEDLKKHYLKALPFLSIDEAKVRHYDTEEYKELKAILEEKDAEIKALRRDFDSMKEIAKDTTFKKESLESLDKLKYR